MQLDFPSLLPYQKDNLKAFLPINRLLLPAIVCHNCLISWLSSIPYPGFMRNQNQNFASILLKDLTVNFFADNYYFIPNKLHFKMKGKNLVLLIIGILLMSMSFIISHYIALPDFTDGLIKGVAIGLMIVSLVFTLKQRKQEMVLK
jgi:hypothetical protein